MTDIVLIKRVSGDIMKKFRVYLLFLLMLPLCFCFSSCKKNKDEDKNENNNPKPEEEIVAPTGTTYSVYFDYNLPDDYNYLLSDRNYAINNKELNTTTALASVPIAKLRKYFLGWSLKGTDEILTSNNVTSSTSKIISLVGNWNAEELKNYYFTGDDDNDFTIVGDDAILSDYSSNGENIIIPKKYKLDDKDYDIIKIADGVFANKTINKFVVNSETIAIGENTFQNSSISAFDFEKVSFIGSSAFKNSNIQEIKFSNQIKNVDVNAFENCDYLTKVDFNGAELSISKQTFFNSSKLKNIVNTQNITSIGEKAFYGCTALENTDFIGENIEIIGTSAFENCTGLTSAVIPENVTELHGDIFKGCTSLEDLTFSVLYRNDYNNFESYFGDISSSLKSITLGGNTITALHQNYFGELDKLETFVMCNSITSIEDYTFRYCTALKNITFSQNIDIDNFTINALNGTKLLSELSEPFVYEGTNNQKSLIYVPQTIPANYSVPENTVKICKNAFMYNTCLQTITIPSTVSFIGDGAFEGCTNLTSVTFSENSNLTTISARMFYGCNKLQNVNISALTSLTQIKAYSFYGVAMSAFNIPSTITEVGNCAFTAAKISSFTSSSIKYPVTDGVLYETNTLNDKLKLKCYPRTKSQSFFVCPENVNKIDIYAFAYTEFLDCVYFGENVNVTWLSSVDGSGTSHNDTAFTSSSVEAIFVAGDNFTSPVGSNFDKNVYRLSSKSYYDGNKIVFDNDFAIVNNRYYYFVNYTDTSNNKKYIVYYHVRATTYDSGTVYEVVANSQKIIETTDLL